MDFCEAFKETVRCFGLKEIDLARESGLSIALCRQFRDGYNVRIDVLQKLLGAMPPEAKKHMLLLVAEGKVSSAPGTGLLDDDG